VAQKKFEEGKHLKRKCDNDNGHILLHLYNCENSHCVKATSNSKCCCVFDQVATCMAVSPDSRTMACGLADCTVRLYRLDTGKVCGRFDSANSELFKNYQIC